MILYVSSMDVFDIMILQGDKTIHQQKQIL